MCTDGKTEHGFQGVVYILNYVGGKIPKARRRCLEYVKKGGTLGRRPELTAGGLVRSAGGWSALRAMRKGESRMKRDERGGNIGEVEHRVFDNQRIHDEGPSNRRRARVEAFGWGY